MPASYAHAPIQFLPDETSGCWIWQRTLDSNGYPQMRVQRKLYQSHLFFYEWLVGPIPEGHQLDHLCRNPLCVNPAHQEPVTCAINVQRSDAAKLSPTDVRAIRAADGSARSIGRRFGISHTHVQKIRRGEAWKEVT